MTTQRAYKFLLPVMIFILAGCFRQASDPVEPVNEALVDQSTPTTMPTNASEAMSPEETEDGQLSVSTSTPVRLVSTATPIPSESPVTATEDSSQSESVTGPVQMESATPLFVTPGVSNQSAISTATPLPTEGPEATPTSLAEGTEEASDGSCIHEIRPGETLYRIALAYGLTVDDIVAANPGINPNFIFVGDELLIPDCDPSDDEEETSGADGGETITTVGSVGEQIHTVVAGDTLYEIAAFYGVSQQAIIDANDLVNPNNLFIGQKLLIPAPAPDSEGQ